jgi:hypothetical protein
VSIDPLLAATLLVPSLSPSASFFTGGVGGTDACAGVADGLSCVKIGEGADEIPDIAAINFSV